MYINTQTAGVMYWFYCFLVRFFCDSVVIYQRENIGPENVLNRNNI